MASNRTMEGGANVTFAEPSTGSSGSSHVLASSDAPISSTVQTKASNDFSPGSTLDQSSTNAYLKASSLARSRKHIQERSRGIVKNIAESLKDDGDGTEHHWFLDSFWWQMTVITLIVLNSLQLGLEADHPDEKKLWEVCEHVFTGCFALEMIVKISFLRCAYFQHHSNWLDFLLVWAAVVDIWLSQAMSNMDGDGALQALSILRLVRLVRVGRVLRLVNQFPHLKIMLKSSITAISMSVHMGGMLFLLLYACSIFCVELIGKDTSDIYPGYTESTAEIEGDRDFREFNPYVYFGTISKSMLTLMNISIGAEFPEIVRPFMLKQPIFVLIFIAFVFIMTFGVMNVLVGMIVDGVLKVAADMETEDTSQEKQRRMKKFSQLQEIIWNTEPDSQGLLSVKILDQRMNEEDMQTLLTSINLPQGCTSKELLRILDHDGDGSLTRDEFVHSFYRLLDSDEFQRNCMAQMGINELKFLVRGFSDLIMHQMKQFEGDITQLVEEVRADMLSHRYPPTPEGFRESSTVMSVDDEYPTPSMLQEAAASHGTSPPFVMPARATPSAHKHSGREQKSWEILEPPLQLVVQTQVSASRTSPLEAQVTSSRTSPMEAQVTSSRASPLEAQVTSNRTSPMEVQVTSSRTPPMDRPVENRQQRENTSSGCPIFKTKTQSTHLGGYFRDLSIHSFIGQRRTGIMDSLKNGHLKNPLGRVDEVPEGYHPDTREIVLEEHSV